MGRQFVVQMDNRPGELAHLARALAVRSINIGHIASVGAGEVACAFISTEDEDATREVLHGLGNLFIEGECIVMNVDDRPGGLADVSERLAEAGVNILGALIVGRRPGIVEMALTVDDEPKALAALGMSEVAVSYVFSRRLSTPVRALVEASRRVAMGDLETRVPVTSNDEIGELASSFNTMAASLRARDEQLKEFARRKVMESERLALVGQLAADVAHELNNPLQGIVTYSSLLLEKMTPDDSRRPSVEKIATQATRCATIIRGLLDFSRPTKPHKKLTDLRTTIDECLSLVEDQVLFQNIEVVRDYQEDLPATVMDPAQMQQVFMNLIINAAEAMGDAGRLTVATRLDVERRVIQASFRDTACGISEENMGRIFDPFFTTKEAGHGTGLGLAISFGIVKEHGGTITVESEEGAGTTFTIELPVHASQGEGQ